MRGRRARAALLLLAAACASPPVDTGRGRPAAGRLPELEERALLLALSDRRFFEPFSLRRILVERPDLGAELATTVGRIGDPRGRALLEELLADRREEVRRSAAFALGLLADPEAAPALLRAAAGPDRETGRLAVEALARAATELDRVRRALADLDPAEARARLLPALHRFSGSRRDEAAAAGLEAPEDKLRIAAAYALTREPRPRRAAELRALLAAPEARIRAWAARALGEVGDAGELERLLPLLDDPDPNPRIQALRAASRLLAEGRAAAPRSWREGLLRLLDDPHAGVRITALEASGHWLRDEELGAALARRVESGGAGGRAALLALAAGSDPRVAERLPEAAAEPDPLWRVAAARAAGILGSESLLSRLEGDAEPQVRLAVLAARLDEAGPEKAAFAAAALADPDPGMRAAALEWLTLNPVVSFDRLLAALAGPGSRFLVELRLNGIAALASRAAAEPLERGAAIEGLEALAGDSDYAVRSRAAAALESLERPRPAVGSVETGIDLRGYRELLERSSRPRRAELVTRHGTICLRLACAQAPLTCVNFLNLANQAFYDGLTFHRVVPDFVVQGGDPRGDGWGGPGYQIRDEPNRIPFRRGVVGMALAGPDTAGSQFFIALSPQPHLDGVFTAFAEVTCGGDLLDRIEAGDRILQLRETGAGERGVR